MRRWGLFFLVCLLIGGGALGFALLNVNRYLNDNRPWIEERVQSATGRRVSFGEMGLSVWGGLGATISNLEIADDPKFSDEPFVRAANVRVKVAILPALFGRVEVREVVLESPLVRIIRTASGMNIDTIGASDTEAPASSPPPREGEGDTGAAVAVIVALFTIRDGEVQYVDRAATPAATTVVKQIDLKVTGLGTPEAATLDFGAAVLGSKDQNLDLSGTVGPLPLSVSEAAEPIGVDLILEVGPADLNLAGSVRLGPPMSVRLALDAVDAPLEGWSQLLPPLAGYELSGTAAIHLAVEGAVSGGALPAVTGTVGVSDVAAKRDGTPDEVEGLSADLQFLGAITECRGEVRIARGRVQNASFEGFVASMSLASEVASLEKSEVSLFDGTYGGTGRYDFREAANPRFEFRQELRGLDVSKILESQAPNANTRMTGRLSGSLEVGGSGDDSDAIRRSLRGAGTVAIDDGVLVGVNLAEEILRSLTGISGLTGLVSDDLREKYVDIFSADDTTFEEIEASVRIADQKVTTEDAVIAARDYALRGEGSVDFDGVLDFTTTFLASRELTADVIESVGEARYIRNGDGRLEVPAKIVGILPDVRVEPDAGFVGRALTKGALGKGLELLGGGTKEKPTSEDEASPAAEGSEEKRPEDMGAELIEKGLRGLFGD